MRATFNVQFYCKASKVGRDGKAPVSMSININGRRVFVNLPRRENPEDFAHAWKSRKTNEIQEFCNKERELVNYAAKEIIDRGYAVTADSIREYMRCGGFRSYTYEDLFDEYLGILKERVGKSLTQGVYEKYVNTSKLFYEYVGDKRKDVTSVNNAIIAGFYRSVEKGYATSTAGGIMTRLKAVFTFARDNGYIKIDPFVNIRITKGKQEIKFLNHDNLETIKNLKLNGRLERVRDTFIFQANSGLSYCDLADLRLEDIREDNGTYYIYKRRRKTGNPFTAVILPDGVEIMKKYPNGIPVLVNQKYNSYLKEIGDLARINMEITTHVARRTYATTLINKGVRLETISKCLGHSSTKITQAHYASLMKDTIIDEVRKVM